jgi:hypothetical protein
MQRLGRYLAWLGLALGASALALQFGLSWTARLAKGDTVLGMLWFYFTFFTILSNGMLVLVYLSELIEARWLGCWRLPATRGMMAGTMAVVSIFYHLMLASLWSPTGSQLVADIALHYAAPWLYVAWWLLQPHGRLAWRDVATMTLFPLAYLAWAMLRGAIVGEYPYPILEANRLGYGPVALNCLAMLALFLTAFAVVVLADRWLRQRGAAT